MKAFLMHKGRDFDPGGALFASDTAAGREGSRARVLPASRPLARSDRVVFHGDQGELATARPAV